jgi:hypothetical protein
MTVLTDQLPEVACKVPVKMNLRNNLFIAYLSIRMLVCRISVNAVLETPKEFPLKRVNIIS